MAHYMNEDALVGGVQPRIWRQVRERAVPASLMQICLRHIGPSLGNARPIIGIDASATIKHCVRMQGESGALSMFFERLCRLLTLPATIFFIFDRGGPLAGTSHVDGTRAGHYTFAHAFSRECLEIIADLGFTWLASAGEAAADLAILEQRGAIKLIMSDDISPLIFGASKMVCWPSNDLAVNGDPVAVDLLHSWRIRRDDLVLVALLCAGKHFQGFRVSSDVAFRLRAYDLSDDLVRLAHAIVSPAEHLAARQAWRQRLYDALAHDALDVLPKGADQLSADKIPINFPSTAILNLVRAYYNPLVDLTTPVPQFQGSTKPNLAGIIHTVYRRFYPTPAGFPGLRQLTRRLIHSFWPGVILYGRHAWNGLDVASCSALRTGFLYFGLDLPPALQLFDPVTVAGSVRQPGTWRGISGARIRVDTEPLISAIARVVRKPVQAVTYENASTLEMCIPYAVLVPTHPLAWFLLPPPASEFEGDVDSEVESSEVDGAL
ncbi:hypothetical protein PENSPDRAFT_693489 [Peniophora sp. CONT]|nr:hypothetical protein PENSPDRAFT_693489 [Peniophora sp. CONT]